MSKLTWKEPVHTVLKDDREYRFFKILLKRTMTRKTQLVVLLLAITFPLVYCCAISPTATTRPSVAARDADASCRCERALLIASQRSNKAVPQIGSVEMLNLALSHSQKMAEVRQLSPLPIKKLNVKKDLQCGTYISGSFVARVAARSDAAAECAKRWHFKQQFSRRFQRKLAAVVGVHESDGTAWCTVVLGVRTAFANSGICGRVICPSKPVNTEPMEKRKGEPWHLNALKRVRIRVKDGQMYEFVLVCRKANCEYCMVQNARRCYSSEKSADINNYLRSK